MRQPVHPGEQLRVAIRDRGLSAAEAGRRIGVSRQTVHGITTGRMRITPAMARRLEEAIGGTAHMWLDLQVRHDLANVGPPAGKLTKAEQTHIPIGT